MMKQGFTYLLLAAVLTLSGASAFALNPSRQYKEKPDKYSIPYEEKTIVTPDGAKLKAWYFPCPAKKTNECIIISHNGEGNMADYLSRVTRFTSHGFNVLTYDYRGFGESSDFEIDNEMLVYPEFCTDFTAVFEYVKKNMVANISVYGWGVGGGLSMGVGYHLKGLKRIVADAPYTTLSETKKIMAVEGMKIKIPDIGFNKQYEPSYSLENANTGVRGILIIVGGDEKGLNEKVMKEMQKKNKKLVSIEAIAGADNANTYENDKDAYVKMAADFFKLL